MRRAFIFVIALAVLSGGVVTALGTAHQRDTHLRGYVDPTADANLPYKVPRRGVNAALEQYTSQELSSQLDLMQSAHITWVRQVISWESIEPTVGEYDWQQWDRVINAVAERDSLQLIAVLYGAPHWARPPASPDHPTAPPADPDVFAEFVAQFAERYGQHIDHYQIWDEPNLDDAWGGQHPRPAAYAALLQAAHTVIHSADADATVIAAALAPTTETGPENLSETLYLRDLYALGASDFFDAVGAKPYGFNHSPDDRTVADDLLNISRIVMLREIMVANGDGHKAIWASNGGWNSLPPDWAGDPSIWGQVPTETRVNYTFALLARAEREWSWMAGMTLHHWQPIAAADDPVWGFALVDQSNEPTPLLTAFTQQAPPQVASNGLFPPDTPYARYSGVWTFGELGADVGWLSDSQLAFDFHGRDVALLLRQGDFVAYLYPRINGADANAVPTDADGNRYVVLTSATRLPEQSVVTIARNLPDEPHTLEVIADRGWDQWVLVGYAVSNGSLIAPYNRQIRLAWLVVGLAAAATVVTGWYLPWRRITTPLTGVWQRLGRIWQFVLGFVASSVLLLGMFLTWGSGTPNILRREPIVLGIAIVTAGIMYLSPTIILTVAAALVLFYVFFHRVDVGVLLTLLWTPFFLFPVDLWRFAFPVAEVLLLLTVGAWALRSLHDWAQAQRQSPGEMLQITVPTLSLTDWGVMAYVVLGFVSLSWAQYFDPAVTDLRVMIIEPALFYVVYRAVMREPQQVQHSMNALLVAALVASVIGLGMYVAGQNVITAEGNARRLAGVYGSPNNMALFLGRVIPFALAFTLISTQRQQRLLAGASLGTSLLAFALTQSVGGLFIGLPVAVAVVLLLSYRRRALVPLAGLVALGAASFAFLARFPRFGGVLDFTSGTNFRRLRVWQSGWRVVQDHPVTGLGLDQFLYAFRSYYILPDAWQEPDLSHPHNFILDFWTRLGVLGIMLFLGLQALFWRNIVRLYQRQQVPAWARAAAIGCAGAMANLLAHGLVDNSVFVNDLATIFLLLLALPQQISVALGSAQDESTP